MKDSKRFVVSTLLVIGIGAAVAGVGGGIISRKEPKLPASSALTRDISKKEVSRAIREKERESYSFEEAFETVEIIGAWQVKLEAGEEYRVTVEAPEKAMNNLSVEKKGDTLQLDFDRWTAFMEGAVEATVTMPTIRRIEAEGGSKITVTGFSGDDFDLKIEGASNVKGIENSITNLTIEADGAVSIDFEQSLVTNAHIELAGAGSVDLRMNGGRLTGSIEGLGNVTYYGDVEVENISTEGLSDVERGGD